MTSTVLDGVLCLLLISAAVVSVTVATPREPAGPGRADEVATTLATATASVNYTLAAPPGTGVDARASTGDALDRTAHGTLAELLARAAVGRLSVDGRRLAHGRDDLGRAVVRAVGSAVRSNHTQVVAVWRPYPGSSVGGRIAVGERPPPDVPVHAATLAVPSGFPTSRSAARTAAAERGLAGVAAVVADGVVSGLFPPTRTRIAADGSTPAAALVDYRYRRLQRLAGVRRPARLAESDVSATNDRLAAALSELVARDLRRGDPSATTAAERLRLGRVRIVVRTWP